MNVDKCQLVSFSLDNKVQIERDELKKKLFHFQEFRGNIKKS